MVSLTFHPPSRKDRRQPGPKGPSPDLVSAIVEIIRKNPNFGYQRIADQISLAFDIEIDKDVVRRVLARHYRAEAGPNGPCWLTSSATVNTVYGENCCCTKNITTEIVFTEGSTVLPLMNEAVSLIVKSLTWTTIAGKSTAAICINSQQRLEC